MNTIYTALIGEKTKYSISDIMYDEIARTVGLRCQHLKIDVKIENFADSVVALELLGFRGCNITIPYKRLALKYLDQSTDEVSTYGAVNTIHFNSQRKGYNTDINGIVEPIYTTLKNRELTERRAVIFGSGGAARAAITASHRLQCDEIKVLARTPDSEATVELRNNASALGIEVLPYTEIQRVLKSTNIVINTTPCGMPNHDATPFDLTIIKDMSFTKTIFLDAVYNPVRTPLLQFFDMKGAEVIDGLWMMLYQGIAAFSIWANISITLDSTSIHRIYSIIKREINARV